ncbi:MAG: hypothetical protein R6U96_08445 [Promethearchaeia archaeon]
MACKHGLDASSCPICRLEYSITPKQFSEMYKSTINLRPQGQRLKKHLERKREIKKRVKSSSNYKRVNLMNLRPDSPFINGLPDFRTQAFKERLEDIELGNIDKFGLTKKVKITSSELNPEKTRKE